MACMDWQEGVHLPTDVLPVVARQLANSSDLHTLSTLLLLSSTCHRQLGPVLYAHLYFPSSDELHRTLRCLTRTDRDSLRSKLPNALEWVRSIRIDEVPSPPTTALILDLSDRFPHRIFPNVHTINISEYALGQLSETAPSVSYNLSKALTKRQMAVFRLAQPRTLKEICPAVDHRTPIPISDLMTFTMKMRDSWSDLVRLERWAPNSDSSLSLAFRQGDPVVLAFKLHRLPQCRFPTGWSDTIVGAYLSSLARKLGIPETTRPPDEDDANWSTDRRRAFITYISFGLTTALERGSVMAVKPKEHQWKLEVNVGPG